MGDVLQNTVQRSLQSKYEGKIETQEMKFQCLGNRSLRGEDKKQIIQAIFPGLTTMEIVRLLRDPFKGKR